MVRRIDQVVMMKGKELQFFKFVVTLTTISFILHLGWEYAQCVPFFIHGEVTPTTFSMLKVSLGDVALTWLAYSIVSLFSKSFLWGIGHWNFKQWFLLSLVAIVLSVVIEIYALDTGRWWYADINPLIFGKISLIPILQLLTLFPLSIKLSKCIFLRSEKGK